MNRFLPTVNQRGLLFMAGLAWLATSGFLIFHGVANILSDNTAIFIRILISLPIGLLLFFTIFKKVIAFYLKRIFTLEGSRHFILSFMGLKGYAFLLFMSALNFSFQLYKIIALDYVFTFQAVMSVPIFLCALMFFKAWKTYQK